MINKIKKELRKLVNSEKAKIWTKFFKIEKNEYGEGDKLLGIAMPEQHKIANEYYNKISIENALRLLRGKYHEERMLALLILMLKYKKGTEAEKKKIFNAYLANTKYINNWDLVDVTCRDIIGAYLFDKNRNILYKLAKSEDLWKKRIAIVSTFYFISKGDLNDTFKISEILLKDKYDLIHKAVGWMLREAGKHDKPCLLSFLDKHGKSMPRTALRYSIEKFSLEERKYILAKY